MRSRWLAATAALVMGTALLESGDAGAQYYPNQQVYYQPQPSYPPLPIQPTYQPQLYNNQNQAYQFQRFYYYPYYYFDHNYWPVTSPRWPEAPGQHYMPPPAYMAFPPFHEPNWRYEAVQPAKYYRGFHFWLDQF